MVRNDGLAQTEQLRNKRGWKYHYNGTAALSAQLAQPAPTAGESIYLEWLIFSTGAATASDIRLLEGATVVFGPLYTEAVAGRGVAIQFLSPIKFTPATALLVSTTGNIAQSVELGGFIASA